MNNAVIVFFIVVLIITIRITISIQFNYDVLENNGEVKIKLFNFIKVFSANIKVSGPFIKLSSKKAGEKLVKLDLQDKNIKFINDLQKNIINKIYLIAFNSIIIFGSENSLITTSVMQIINIINAYLFVKILNFESDASISMQTFPVFAQNKTNIYFNTKFIISIFYMLYALLKTILEGKKLNYGK